MEKFTTSNLKETQAVGVKFVTQLLRKKPGKQAVVLALSGDLGSGKTTFLQGFAKGLGIEEVVNSPTFIIMKKFQIPKAGILKNGRPSYLGYKYFYHLDLYRLENPNLPAQAGDLEFLHFEEIISDPKNIIAVEWPEKVKEMLPKNVISITFKHLEESKRELTINK